MARGVNKIILVGNVGGEPETRYTQDGKAVTNISLATSESWKDKQTGNKQERTEWHNIVFFGKLAEIVGEYVRKGSKLYVEGSLNTQEYTKEEDGIKRWTTKIKASEMQMLDSRNELTVQGNPVNPAGGQGVSNPPQQASAAAQAPTAQANYSQGSVPSGQVAYAGQQQGRLVPAQPPAQPQGGFEQEFDDDIPF